MKYILRDKNGAMKLSMSQRVAAPIFADAVGRWRPYCVPTNKSTSAFEFTEDQVFGPNEELRIFFWKGDILVPASD